MAAVVVGKWEKDYDPPEQARKALHATGQKKKNEIESSTPPAVEVDKIDVH